MSTAAVPAQAPKTRRVVKKEKVAKPAPEADDGMTTVDAGDSTIGGESTMTVDISDPNAKKRSNGERSFTLVYVSKGDEKEERPEMKNGRYISRSPAGAGRKSSNKVFRTLFDKDDNNCVLYITMKETTKGSKKEEYPYKAIRTLIDPREVSFKGAKEGKTVVPFKYDIKLKSERVRPEKQPKPAKVKKEKAAVGGSEAEPSESAAEPAAPAAPKNKKKEKVAEKAVEKVPEEEKKESAPVQVGGGSSDSGDLKPKTKRVIKVKKAAQAAA